MFKRIFTALTSIFYAEPLIITNPKTLPSGSSKRGGTKTNENRLRGIGRNWDGFKFGPSRSQKLKNKRNRRLYAGR